METDLFGKVGVSLMPCVGETEPLYTRENEFNLHFITSPIPSNNIFQEKMIQAVSKGTSLRLSYFFVIFVLSFAGAYPLVGSTKRYQRPWAPLPLVYQPTRAYAPYYDPYPQEVSDVIEFYFPQDPYEKYRLYQVPYYYPEQYYYDEEEEPEEEEIPYGQETWYNNGNAEANAMFLQNLIMAQMYRDAANKGMRYPINYPPKEDYDDEYVYGEPVREASDPPKEDSDVRELKSLVGGKERRLEENRRSKMENRWVDKRSRVTTQAPEVSTKKNKGGQDEVVMPRPATPVRAPSSFHHRAYKPSVYDAIKKLLNEQKNNEGLKPRQPQKRSYVLSEDALVEQLGSLKKAK